MANYFCTSSFVNFSNDQFVNNRRIISKLNIGSACGHSANKPVENKNGELIAVRCNCGRKAYHLVNGEVHWNHKVSARQMHYFRQKGLSAGQIMAIINE